MSTERRETTAADAERAQRAADTVDQVMAALVRGDPYGAARMLAAHTAYGDLGAGGVERSLVELACAGVAAAARIVTDSGSPTGCQCGREDCPGWSLGLVNGDGLDTVLPPHVVAALRGLTAALNGEPDAARDVFEAVRAAESIDVLGLTATAAVRMAADAREQIGDGAS